MVGVAVGAAILLSGTTLAKAGREAVDAGERMAQIHGMVASLDLTSDQKAKILAIARDEKPQIDPILEQLKANGKALQRATDSTDADNATVCDLADRQGKLVARLTVEGANVKTRVFDVLTPHQRSRVMRVEARIDRDLEDRHFGDMLSEVLN